MRPVLTILPAFLLAACQAEPETPSEAPAAEASLNPAQQAFADANARMHAAMGEIPEDADEAFMRGMLAHHRGAVEMAEVELEHGTDPAARDLARRVKEAQSAEIAEMEAWLAERGVSAAPANAAAAHEGH